MHTVYVVHKEMFTNSNSESIKNINVMMKRVSNEVVEEQWILKRKTNKSRYAVTRMY